MVFGHLVRDAMAVGEKADWSKGPLSFHFSHQHLRQRVKRGNTDCSVLAATQSRMIWEWAYLVFGGSVAFWFIIDDTGSKKSSGCCLTRTICSGVRAIHGGHV